MASPRNTNRNKTEVKLQLLHPKSLTKNCETEEPIWHCSNCNEPIARGKNNKQTKNENKCTVSCTEISEEEENQIPRIQLKLSCPGSLFGYCDKKRQIWQCKSCKTPITRGIDDYFHCDCGKSKPENFWFKCSSEHHGTEFVPFPPGEISKSLKDIPELNILVIGAAETETSTWLNALVNYISFPTLGEAVHGLLSHVTPLSFNIIDENDVTHNVKFGINETENENIRVVIFPSDNWLIRLIDVPGLRINSDVENIKKHFQKLILYLRKVKDLHGICMLPKLNPHFELIFSEFVNHFDLRAMTNVFFCFLSHKLVKTKVFLAKLLWRNKVQIALDSSRILTTNNNCFQFVCATKQNIRFKEIDTKVYSKFWMSSVEETNRLISYLKKIKPHNTMDTVSWMKSRKNVPQTCKSLSHAIIKISKDIGSIKLQIEQCDRENADTTHIKLQNSTTNQLPHLQTVCVNQKCSKSDGTSNTTCHSNCFLEDIPLGIAGDQRLLSCSAMNNGESLYCTVCGCFWDEHLQTNYVIMKDIEPENVRVGGNLIRVCDAKNYIEELEKEQQKLIEISVQIGRYLSSCSLMNYSERMMQYIQHSCDRSPTIPPIRGGFHGGGSGMV